MPLTKAPPSAPSFLPSAFTGKGPALFSEPVPSSLGGPGEVLFLGKPSLGSLPRPCFLGQP